MVFAKLLSTPREHEHQVHLRGWTGTEEQDHQDFQQDTAKDHLTEGQTETSSS